MRKEKKIEKRVENFFSIEYEKRQIINKACTTIEYRKEKSTR